MSLQFYSMSAFRSIAFDRGYGLLSTTQGTAIQHAVCVYYSSATFGDNTDSVKDSDMDNGPIWQLLT